MYIYIYIRYTCILPLMPLPIAARQAMNLLSHFGCITSGTLKSTAQLSCAGDPKKFHMVEAWQPKFILRC